MLTIPYVTVAAFRAHPTFLDTLNLRSGDTNAADQDQELRNILLEASGMVDDYLEFGTSSANDGILQAHTRTEQRRIRIDRSGRLKFHPDHHPVLSVSAVSYGQDPLSMQSVPDLSGLWIEDERQVLLPLAFGAGMTQIQFGTPVYDSEVYLRFTYTSGYPNTLLTATATAGAMSIPVADATGLTGGSSTQQPTTLRIWDPGNEEAVTVASSYTPGSLTVPLTAPLANTHTVAAGTPVGVSGMPWQVHMATIFYGCALLQRPDSETEDVFPGARRETNTRIGGQPNDGSGWVAEAERLLENLRRVR